MTGSKLGGLVLAGLLALTATGLTACEKKQGPGERAGEKIDEAVDKVKDAIDPKGPAEKAGEKVDKALGNDR
jgi:hypothetical protein